MERLSLRWRERLGLHWVDHVSLSHSRHSHSHFTDGKSRLPNLPEVTQLRGAAHIQTQVCLGWFYCFLSLAEKTGLAVSSCPAPVPTDSTGTVHPAHDARCGVKSRKAPVGKRLAALSWINHLNGEGLCRLRVTGLLATQGGRLLVVKAKWINTLSVNLPAGPEPSGLPGVRPTAATDTIPTTQPSSCVGPGRRPRKPIHSSPLSCILEA